jgi:hypothetical protein
VLYVLLLNREAACSTVIYWDDLASNLVMNPADFYEFLKANDAVCLFFFGERQPRQWGWASIFHEVS